MPSDDREERIRALFTTHYPGLCRLAYLIVGDAAQAEEIVMDAFMRTFVSWRRLRDLEKADAYLRRAVVNLSRSRMRRRHLEERTAPAPPKMSLPDSDRLDADRVVWEAVRRLPSRQRATIILRYYEDLTEFDVARALGCSVGTVKSQLAKARVSLAKSLATEEGVPR